MPERDEFGEHVPPDSGEPPRNEGDEPRVPTDVDLASLPRWACVAFAARCARRVQPLFSKGWPDAPQKYIDAVDRAIALAEDSAARPDTADPQALQSVASAAHFGFKPDFLNFANYAVECANAAALSAWPETTVNANSAAHAAAALANASAVIVPAMWWDYELLCELAKGAPAQVQIDGGKPFEMEGLDPWTDETPVPPEIFGPLWPEGEPKGWPIGESGSDTKTTKKVVIQFMVPTDVPPEDAQAAMLDLVVSASRLHVAYGGSGLVVRTAHVFEGAGVPAEVDA